MTITSQWGYAGQQHDAEDGERGHQRTNHRNEFQHSADRAQHQGVLDTHDAQKCGVDDQGESGQSQVGRG